MLVETEEKEEEEVIKFREKIEQMNLYSISSETVNFVIQLQKDIFPVYESEKFSDENLEKKRKKEELSFDYPPKYLGNDIETFEEEEKVPQILSSGGLSLILTVICSSMRNVENRNSKLTATRLLIKMSKFLNDECRLQRIVPYLFSLLNSDDDEEPLVVASVITGVTDVVN